MASHLAPWIVVIGRLGQATKGVVYLSLSMLAAQAVWAGGGKTGGSRGAISAIAEQPFGRVLLFIVAGGLACYVLWRLVDAFGPDGRETDAKGLALRARSFAIALIYSGLTAAAVRTLMGNSSGKGGGDSAAQDWTARVLAQPFGSTLVVIAGAAVILGGLYKGWRAYAGKFEKKLDLSDLLSSHAKVAPAHLPFWTQRAQFHLPAGRRFLDASRPAIERGQSAWPERRSASRAGATLRPLAFRHRRRGFGRLRALFPHQSSLGSLGLGVGAGFLV